MRRLACALLAATAAAQNGERIVVGLVDGLVVTLDAWSGQAVGAFSSGAPLVRDHGAGVVPGVDGRIYQFDDDLEPRALPATAQELAAMDVPMMACENLPDTLVPASEGPAWRNCGILTSHREKSIWAVDVDTGELQWVHPDDGKNNERNKGKGTPAFLQREEYTVAAMDAQTGTESWSVSVAHLSAFGLTSADVSERVGVVAVAGLLKKEKKDCMEEGSVGWECEARLPPKFPSLEVASTTTGYAVTAFDEDRIVWTTDLPALPTEFFGASRTGAWSSLAVTAPRENSQALVAGPSVDLLAHAVGRPLSSDLAENARLAARVARAAGPPVTEYSPNLKLLPMPNATAALPLKVRRELLLLRVLLVALALGAGWWVLLRRRKVPPQRTPSPALLPLPDSQIRTTQSLSALGSLQKKDDTPKPPPAIPELGPDALVSTARYEREFDEREKLGRGGFGTVAKATNKLDKIDYAIKKIRLSSDVTWRPRLDKMLREVKILALLDHPHIVRYYQAWLEAGSSDAGLVHQSSNASLTSAVQPPSSATQAWTQDEVEEPFTETLKSFDMCASDMPSMAPRKPVSIPQQKKKPSKPVNYDLVLHIQMQYCSSRTLRDFLDEKDDDDQSLKIFAQIARGLTYVHERGLVHRDLKPANIFLIDGVAKIGDFGLSRHVGFNDALVEEDEEEEDEDITRGVGTRLYAAPEQLASDDYDEKADVYSLGVVLYELLRPRFGTTMERVTCISKIARASSEERLRILREELPHIDKDVAELVSTALARDPADRPAAAEAASVIERALDADVVRQMKKDGAATGDGTVILRAPNGDVRVYSDDGVFLSERPAGRSASEAVSEPSS